MLKPAVPLVLGIFVVPVLAQVGNDTTGETGAQASSDPYLTSGIPYGVSLTSIDAGEAISSTTLTSLVFSMATTIIPTLVTSVVPNIASSVVPELKISMSDVQTSSVLNVVTSAIPTIVTSIQPPAVTSVVPNFPTTSSAIEVIVVPASSTVALIVIPSSTVGVSQDPQTTTLDPGSSLSGVAPTSGSDVLPTEPQSVTLPVSQTSVTASRPGTDAAGFSTDSLSSVASLGVSNIDVPPSATAITSTTIASRNTILSQDSPFNALQVTTAPSIAVLTPADSSNSLQAKASITTSGSPSPQSQSSPIGQEASTSAEQGKIIASISTPGVSQTANSVASGISTAATDVVSASDLPSGTNALQQSSTILEIADSASSASLATEASGQSATTMLPLDTEQTTATSGISAQMITPTTTAAPARTTASKTGDSSSTGGSSATDGTSLDSANADTNSASSSILASLHGLFAIPQATTTSSTASKAPNRVIADPTTRTSTAAFSLTSGQTPVTEQLSRDSTTQGGSGLDIASQSITSTDTALMQTTVSSLDSHSPTTTTFITGTLASGSALSDSLATSASRSGVSGILAGTGTTGSGAAPTNGTTGAVTSNNAGTPMIVGATIGSIIGAALSAFALFFFCFRHKQRKRGRRSMYEQPPMVDASHTPSRMSVSSRATTLARGVEMDAEGDDGMAVSEPDYDDGEIRDLHDRGCLAQMQRIIRRIFELETVERPQELETVEKPQELEAEETTCLAATQAFLMRVLGIDQHKFEEVENIDYLDEAKRYEPRKVGQLEPSRRTSVTFAVPDKDYIEEKGKAKGQDEQAASKDGSNEEWTDIDFIEEIKAQNRKHFGHAGLSNEHRNETRPTWEITTQRGSMIHPALRGPEPLVSPIAELHSRAILSPIMEHRSRPGSIISPLTEVKSQPSSVGRPSPNLRSQQGSQRSMSTITSKKSSGETTQTAEGLEDFMDWMSKHKSPPTSP